MKRNVKKVLVKYAAHDVWAAAAAVFRINEGYIKDPIYNYDPATYETTLRKDSNKSLIKALLLLGNGWTEEDIAVGKSAQTYWQGGVMKMLADEKLSDFSKLAIKISEKEDIDSFYDIAVIGSLIGAAKRGQHQEELEYQKSIAPGEWLGNPNTKIHLNSLTVTGCFYNANYASYRNEGTQNGNYVSWWGKEKFEVGQQLNVNARIKACITDSKTNAKITQINYVKAVK